MENPSPFNGTPKINSKAKTMSSVEAFTPEITAAYARKMIERESRGNGDQLNALERVGRRCGMTARSLRRLVNGETKDPGMSVFAKVRSAYLDYCARQIAELQHELEIEQLRFGSEHFQDLDDEASALMAKIQAAKERLRT